MPSRESSVFRAMALMASMALALPACERQPLTSPDDAALAAASSDLVVSSTSPSSATRDTTLDVHVLGSGFDRGSKVAFALDGTVDEKVKVNSTKYVKSSDLLANVTIAADASVELYDVIVTTSGGKKGIGTEIFEVLSMIDLGTPSGGYSYGRDVNSSGTVVGEYQESGSSCKKAFVWTDAAGLAVLPQSSLGCINYATAINDAGVIVGHVYGTGPRAALRWTPNGDGSWTLEHLPDPSGFTLGGGGATDIAEDGTILAEYLASDDGTYRQLVLRNEAWHLLKRSTAAELSSCWINGFGVNDAGEAVGTDCVGALFWASLSADPTYLPLPSEFSKGVAFDINDAGAVAGKATITSTGKRRAIRWVPDGSGGFTHTELPDLGGGEAEARAINRNGQIGGWSSTSSGSSSMRAFLWSEGTGMLGLGTLQNHNAAALGISNTDFGFVYLSGWSVSSKRGSYQRAVRWTE